MAVTIFLSKALGISLVTIGAVLMIRRRYFSEVFSAFVRVSIGVGLGPLIGIQKGTPLNGEFGR
jgi:hypothetical protein